MAMCTIQLTCIAKSRLFDVYHRLTYHTAHLKPSEWADVQAHLPAAPLLLQQALLSPLYPMYGDTARTSSTQSSHTSLYTAWYTTLPSEVIPYLPKLPWEYSEPTEIPKTFSQAIHELHHLSLILVQANYLLNNTMCVQNMQYSLLDSTTSSADTTPQTS